MPYRILFLLATLGSALLSAQTRATSPTPESPALAKLDPTRAPAPDASYILGPNDQVTVFVANSPGTLKARKLLILGSATSPKMAEMPRSTYVELTAQSSVSQVLSRTQSASSEALATPFPNSDDQLNIFVATSQTNETPIDKMPIESRSRMVCIRLSAQEYERFREQCYARGLRSVSGMVRAAVNHMLAAPESHSQLESRISDVESRLQDLTHTVERLRHTAFRQTAS